MNWARNTAAVLSTQGRAINPAGAGIAGFALGLPLAAYQASKAQRGEALPEMSTQVAYPALAGLMTAGIGWAVPAFRIVAPLATPMLAALLQHSPAAHLGNSVFRTFRAYSQLDRSVRRLEMGGDYRDNEIAVARRMRAVQDMTGTMGSARRWLGSEALAMHR